MRILCELDSVSSVCLYDTGSSYNILSSKYFNHLCENRNFSGSKKSLKPYNGQRPIAVTGAPMKIAGEINFSVNIAGLRRSVKFVVAFDSSEPCILGRPGIDAFGTWKYVPKAKKLTLRGRNVLLVDSHGRAEQLCALIKNDDIIPPRTTKFITFEVPNRSAYESELLLVEPSPDFCDDIGLVALCSIVQKNGEM